jgi:hypothetical protein
VNAWIHVPYWWHATLLEVSWLATGVASATLTVLNLIDSWKDNDALKVIRHDPSVHDRHYQMVKLAAHGRTSSQMTRLVISLLIMFTGTVGVFQANPLGGRTTWTGLTVTVCLVAIGALTAARSYGDYRQRNLLYEMATKRTSVIAARLRAAELEDKHDEGETP